jgi:amidohydrolase
MGCSARIDEPFFPSQARVDFAESLREIRIMHTPARVLAGLFVAALATAAGAQPSVAELEAAAAAVEPAVIEWRRDLHAHPELSNRETRTAALIAKELRALGLEVKTAVGVTGVTGLLRGRKAGRTVALRADMDALPVTEHTDVPFKSKVTATFRGETVGVMHACGHDAHVAILLGTARILAGMREKLAGQVLFIFQPAEEGAPDGERGGARLMLEEGLFEGIEPDAVYALHVMASLPTGVIGYRPGPLMAGSDGFSIQVHGRQTHGSRPWAGVDPIIASAQILMGLQTIVSRQLDITEIPAVVTVGAIKGGIRFNIIPDTVEMIGTVRSFDTRVREDIVRRMQSTVEQIAQANGATASVKFREELSIPPVINDVALTEAALPVFERLVGAGNVRRIGLQTVADDFSFFGAQVPGLYFWVGITPPDRDPQTAPFNHSPLFYLDETGMRTGVRALLALATEFLASGSAATVTRRGAPGRDGSADSASPRL